MARGGRRGGRPADRADGAAAGPRAALGPARGAGDDPPARGCCSTPLAEALAEVAATVRECAALRQHRHRRALRDLRRPGAGRRARSAWSRRSPTSGRWSAAAPSAAATTCSAACSRRSTASGRRRCASPSWWRGRRRRAAREVILALNATIDGQTTAHYIADQLAPLGVARHLARQGRADRRRARLSRRRHDRRGAAGAPGALKLERGQFRPGPARFRSQHGTEMAQRPRWPCQKARSIGDNGLGQGTEAPSRRPSGNDD